MARDDPHFRLRIPQDLRSQIAEAAKANGRSLNAEIVHRLERTFQPAYEFTPEMLDQMKRFMQQFSEFEEIARLVGTLPKQKRKS